MPRVRLKQRIRAIVGAFIMTAVVFAGADSVKAHASLVGSTPVYGSTLTEAPTTLQLQFDNFIEPGLVKVRLKDSADVEIGKGTLIGDRSPRNQVEFSLPEHGTGSYLITWVTFAFDGHVVSGTIPYTVDPDASATATSTGGDTTDGQTIEQVAGDANRIIDIVEIQLRFLQYLGLAALFGGLVWLFALRGADGDAATLVGSNGSKFVFAGGAGAAVFALARVASGAWRFIDGGYGGGVILERIIDGQLGAGIVAAGLFATAAFTTTWSIGTRASVAAVGTMLSASVGHGASAPVPGLNSVLMGLHLTAAAVWVGGVMLIAYIASDKQFTIIEDRWSGLRQAMGRLGSMFIIATGVLAVTGVRAAYVYSDGIPDGQWGLTLAAKVVMVVGAALIGLFHHLRGRRGETWKTGTLGVEAALLILTLTAAAVLTVTTV